MKEEKDVFKDKKKDNTGKIRENVGNKEIKTDKF